MKKIFSLALIAVFICFSAFSKAQQKVDWKQKSDFHKVMSQTFHPAEEGNYEPIKKRSAEMYEKAIAWKNSAIPAEFSHQKDIKKNLKALVKGSKKLDKKIKAGASDEVIKTELTALHDVFHTIVGLCSAEDKHDQH